MTIKLIAILIHLLIFQHAPLTVNATSNAERLAELQKKTASSRGGLISASVPNIRNFIESAPRSYNVIVMFSADKSICEPCKKVSNQFRTVATDYHSMKRKGKANPTFFVEVMLTSSERTFLSDYQIQHIPIIYHFGAGRSKSYPTALSDASPDSLNIGQVGYHSNAIKAFVNDRTGSNMHVIRGGYEIPFVQTVRKLMPYIASFAAFIAVLCAVTGAYKSPMLWFLLVVLVYIFSVGGGHYSWIHNTPLAAVDKSGRMQYIAGGSRSQYVAEGFFVSFTCVCISGLVITIQEMPSFVPYKGAQTALGSIMFLLTVGAIGSLLMLYQMKMPQYLQYSEM